MKRIGLLVYLSAVITGHAAADIENAGLSGEVTLLTGYNNEESNFNTDNAIKSSPLNSKGESDSSFILAPLGQVRYTFGQNNNHQLFLGTSRSDIITGVFALEVGYKTEVQPESTMAFSVLPTIINGETWADPFITDKARKKTDVKGNVYRINYENILHTGLSADIAYYDKEIDNEESGEELFGSANSSLNRNGHGYYSKLSMPLYYDGTTLLTPAFLYQHFSADGKAMSHDKYGLNLTYVRFIGRHSFALSGDATITSFDELHPVFNKEQEDKGYSVSMSYEYDKFLNMNDWSFNIVLGYDRTASNIDFYEETQYYSTLGVSYHF